MADTPRKDPAKKPSVTRHKLFPAVVVVWFAALFGLVSLAIRPAAMESLVLATGIDHVIAKAAPPLGNTMRLVLALFMTALGALIGLIVARRIATQASPATTRRSGATPTDANVSPVAALGHENPVAKPDEDEDQVEPVARRRRQLALLDEPDSAQDDRAEDHAPLPGNGQILDVAELPLKSFDEIDGIWLHESDRSSAREAPAPVETYANGTAYDVSNQDADAAETVAHEADVTSADQANGTLAKSNNRLFDSYVRRVNAGVGSNDSDATAPGFVSLPSSDAGSAEEPPVAMEEETVASEPPAPVAAEPITNMPTYGNTAERIAQAPLDELSHVELLERLAQTIARRRSRSLAAAEPAPAVVDAAQAEEPDNVAVLPRFAAAPSAAQNGEVPAALRPHWADIQQDDDDDDALAAYVPARSIAMPKAASEADDVGALEEGYASLRGMTKPETHRDSNPHGEAEPAQAPQPARFAFAAPISDTPAPAIASPGPRMFDAPTAAEPASDQTEQALRAALATLRRMSGTA